MGITMSGGLVLNIYTFILALMLLLFQENDRRSKSNIAFIKLVSILALLVGVSAAGDIARELGPNYFFVTRFSDYFIFAFDPLGFLFSLAYIDSYTVYGNTKLRSLFLWFMRIYAVINFVAVTVSAIYDTKWFYYYENFTYQRGGFYLLRGLFHVVLCLVVIVYVIVFKNGINQSYRLPIVLFPGIVALGGLLQVTVSYLNIEYAATVIASMILLIYVQKRDVNLDYLTGIVNRRGIDIALKRAISDCKEREFAAIMIDVDYFKNINDTYGHKAGDEVLESIASVLRASFDDEDVVGRFGGDEFCIITQIIDEKALKHKIGHIKDSIAEMEWSNKGEMNLSISTGVAVYDFESGMKVKDFMEHIDRKMYKEKIEHHLSDRRHYVG
ncbi:MAG: GGDEF domain-containing protein [Butyrivibrio sp.]|nr:GGDEF domain-containing protein [Butyrivibrio sp.]